MQIEYNFDGILQGDSEILSEVAYQLNSAGAISYPDKGRNLTVKKSKFFFARKRWDPQCFDATQGLEKLIFDFCSMATLAILLLWLFASSVKTKNVTSWYLFGCYKRLDNRI